ncbi:hypothetical protein OAU26_07520 [Mariniblastus sp.]|nr:hypothetical protein [Mariniblastus sp.]
MLTKQKYQIELLKIKARRETAERRLAKTMPISKADLAWLREMQNKIPEATRKRIKAKLMSSKLQSAWPAA